MDAMLLYSETPNLHTHTLKVAIIDPSSGQSEFDYDVFRRHLLRRLHLLEPLRYQLVDIPWRLHHPMWLENCEVDLDYHLRRVKVPASARSPPRPWTAAARCGNFISPKGWPADGLP
jgi:diacylglycerol O-acyltransferase